jgi:photosystem II stability/assembly factor-like uncharacterized protein
LEETTMTSRHPRVAVALFSLLTGIAILCSPSSSDVLAQRKGGQKDGKAKEKEPPPPNFTMPEAWSKQFNWRNIGPANMGGRITAISVFEADPSTYWVATASGGLVKTTNNGVTFEHQFDKEATVSIGDVCVAPSDRNVVWVGTGENNPRNSVSFGDGVYKSTDGGKTWKHMGLKKTYQTGKILIHPTNPDIVYVGALGRLYGKNEERGLYKTSDGGKSWEMALHIDDKTGIIDARMHPTNPDILFVATWERQRDEFDSWPGGGLPDGYDAYDPVKKWGPGSGIYKSVDAGKTFKKLTQGLPTNAMGRIGLDIYKKEPNTIFAVIDCEKIGMGTAPKKAAIAASTTFMGLQGEDAEGVEGARITRVTPGGPADAAGLKLEDIVTKAGDKAIKTYEDLTTAAAAAKPNDKVALTVKRGEKVEMLEMVYGERPMGKGGAGGGGGFGGPGGASATRPYAANYGGQAANVQDTQGTDSFQYGGIYKSTDGGDSWKRINSVNPRPMYFSQIRVDPSDDKHLSVLGVSLYTSRDGGKTFQTAQRQLGIHSDQHALWIDPKDGRHQIIGTDGGFYATYDRGLSWDHHNQLALGQFYHVAVCSKKPYWVYGGLQDNGCWGLPSMSLRGVGPVNEDVISINGGDGYVCRVDPNDPDQVYAESQNGGMVRYNLKSGERVSIKPQATGGTRYRFNWNTPYILSAANSHIVYSAGNFVFKSVKKGDNPQIISPEISRTKHGTATALAESPRNPDVLWAGTDDGFLWLTKNGGKDWTNLTEKIGLKKPTWIATIEASRFAEGRAYVAFDGHRMDDDAPYLYMTDDFGDTWKSITGNLPTGSTRCLREDVHNRNLLYCGTEFALYVSLDRGTSWTKLNNNLPTVAVHEVAIHPTAGEIVVATHGRSLWIADVTALRQMASEKIKDEVMLYKPNTLTRWQDLPGRGRTGRRFLGQNPPSGAHIYYSLPKKATKVTLEFQDIDGKKVAELNGPTDAGLNKLSWNTSASPPAGAGAPMGGGGGGGGRGFGGGRQVPPGAYRVVLNVDGQSQSQSFTIEGDPVPPRSLSGEEEEEGDDEETDRE